jgi:hypothetical protein
MIQVMKWWLAAAIMIGAVLVASARGGDAHPAPAATTSPAVAAADVGVPVELQLAPAAACVEVQCLSSCTHSGFCDGTCVNNVCKCLFPRTRPCP